MRLLTVVAILLQVLLVPVQAQPKQSFTGQEGKIVLECHPVVTADCAGGSVVLVGDGTKHDLTIWLDNDTSHPLVDQDDVKSGTWTFDWSERGVNVCSSHKLKAQWSSYDEESFGGSTTCCPGKLLVSHVECTANHQLWVHLILSQSPEWPNYVGTSASFTMNTPNGPVSGSAAYEKRTGGTVHYNYYSSTVPDGDYTVTSGSLTVDGVTWSLNNAGTKYHIAACGEYVPCQAGNVGPWVEYSRGTPYYSNGQWCVDITYRKYDLNTGVKCDEKTEPSCVPYVPCQAGNVGPWVEYSRGTPYYSNGQWCVDITYRKYDLNTGVKCDEKTEPSCVPYVPCQAGSVGPWVEYSRSAPYYSNGQWCYDVTSRKYDLNTGVKCDEKTEPQCGPYQSCTETTDWVLVSTGDWLYDATTNEYYRILTYKKYDLHDQTVECGSKQEGERKPNNNGCNAPSITPSAVLQGNSVKICWSGFGTGVYRLVVELLSDGRDGQRQGGVGGGGWYVLGESGSEGGCMTLSTSWLYPTGRTVRVTAYYPGVPSSSSCYGTLRIRPGPTPTQPVPGFVPCPSCVQDILYQSDRNGNWDIYTAHADGSAEKQLTTSTGADSAPNWFWSGQYVTFQSNRDGNWEVYTMDVSGAGQTNVSQNLADDIAPSWSCRYIYFQSNRDGNWEIYRMNPDGTDQRRLTENAATDAQPYPSIYDRVAFQSNRDGNWEIYTMNSDGTDVKRLTNTPWDEMSPEWSPNGEWIVFQTKRGGQWQLAVMDKDGNNLRYIARSSTPNQAPAWNPYCEWIYFQTYRLGSWDIYRTNQDGTVVQRITTRVGSTELIDNNVQ